MRHALASFLCPVESHENPTWFFGLGRLLLSLTVLCVPLLYDLRVAEVAGDVRWYWLHITSLLLCTLYFAAHMEEGSPLKIQWRQPIAFWCIVAMALLAIISTVDAINPFRSWWFLKHYLSYCLIFVFMYHLRHGAWYRNMLWLLAAGVGANALLGILQFYGITGTTIEQTVPLFGRLFTWIDLVKTSAPPAGTLANKNLAGSYLVFCLPLVFYLFITAQGRIRQGIALALFTLGSIFLVYTRSRGSWVAACGALAFFALWLIFNTRERAFLQQSLKNNVTRAMLAGACVVIIAASHFASPLKGYHSIDKSVGDQVHSIFDMTKGEIGPRMAYNLNGLAMIADHPINGVGIGNFQVTYPTYYKAVYPTPHLGYNIKARPQRMHNDIGQAIVEMGVMAGVVYLILFISLLTMAWRLARQENEKAALMGMFISVSIVGLCVNALGDFPLQMPTAPALLWAFAGALTGLYTLHHPSTENSTNLPSPTASLCAVLSLLLLCGITFESYKRHQSSQNIKDALPYILAGKVNEPVMRLMINAHDIYPWNSRHKEYMSIAYVRYNNKPFIHSLDHQIEVLTNNLQYDPTNPTHMVNLSNLNLRKVKILRALGKEEEALTYINTNIDYFKRMLKVADFSEQTYNAGATAYLTKGDLAVAYTLLKKSLTLNPDQPHIQTLRDAVGNQMRGQGQHIQADLIDGKLPQRKAPPPMRLAP